MKSPLIDRKVLFSNLLQDLWEADFGPAPDYGLRTTPCEAVATGVDPKSIRLYAVRRQLEAVDKKERDGAAGIPNRLVQEALNQRLLNEEDMRKWQLPDGENLAIFERARDYIHSLLPPLAGEWESIFSNCGFGPGAVFHSRGIRNRSLLEKIAGRVQTYTPKLRSLVFPVLDEFYPSWASVMLDRQKQGTLELNVTRGNRLAFVHKDKEKCRCIAVEPSLNVFVQKGIGVYLMNQLRKRWGIDLRDQERNRLLAEKGSKDGACATVDLSSASDRIPTELVRYLLPADWFALLDAARSRESRLPDGTWVVNECFSSQGNGFTFPLETIIFFSIIKQACVHDHSLVTCYGDDIIVPTADYHRATSALQAAGAIINHDKSFHEGNFRESCGGDYLNGVQVRPVYYKEEARQFSQVAGLHNLLIERWGESAIPRTVAYLRSCVPAEKRFTGPRAFFGAHSDIIWANTVSTPYTSYFWCEKWDLDALISYDKALQTYVYTVKEWGHRSVPLPKSVLESVSDDGKLLAFLYAGEDYDVSPASKPCVRIRKLTVR